MTFFLWKLLFQKEQNKDWFALIYKLWCIFELLKSHLFGYKKWYLSYNYTWQKQCQCEITMAGLAINHRLFTSNLQAINRYKKCFMFCGEGDFFLGFNFYFLKSAARQYTVAPQNCKILQMLVWWGYKLALPTLKTLVPHIFVSFQHITFKLGNFTTLMCLFQQCQWIYANWSIPKSEKIMGAGSIWTTSTKKDSFVYCRKKHLPPNQSENFSQKSTHCKVTTRQQKDTLKGQISSKWPLKWAV